MTIYVNLYMMKMVVTTATMGMATTYCACMYVCLYMYIYVVCTNVRICACMYAYMYVWILTVPSQNARNKLRPLGRLASHTHC